MLESAAIVTRERRAAPPGAVMDSCDDTPPPAVVVALYKFAELTGLAGLRAELLDLCSRAGLKGTILLAAEGINAGLAGSREGVDRLLAYLRRQPALANLQVQESLAPEAPFYRLKVQIKQEIVALGRPSVSALTGTGRHLQARAWNALIADPGVTLVDARNAYEVRLGRFANALDPNTESFRDFPEWADANLDPQENSRVAMYCTGGIRCEKASAYLLQKGFAEVYQLQGGILGYLKEIPAAESLWSGECFVFDNRVTVDERLRPGNHEICFNCRMPLSTEDQASALYEKHVSCPHCHHRLTPKRREGLMERARQVALAKARGQAHIGQRFHGSDSNSAD